MTLDMEDLLNSIVDSVERIDCIKLDDIPDIDLYMDQVTTLIDGKLRSTTRNPGDDKILTKTMINNYTKNDLLPPPVKKKYTKEHVLLLIFTYYFKSMLSINDIQAMLAPIIDGYYDGKGALTLEEIYREIFSMEREQVKILQDDVVERFNRAKQTFVGEKEEDKEILQRFSFLCMLCFDVFTKKLMMEKIVDGMMNEQKAKEEKKENKKADKK
ncbi:MAG: DUF1836 domain-containing protein [Lachnospiraceae bacterium]|jgi:hypothetical protein|nr:DUF1836 domain-containing protein [Lachnospiraceae bacterium]SDA72913.1 protein of unknown function [Lachnospiraceae bacterium G11]